MKMIEDAKRLVLQHTQAFDSTPLEILGRDGGTAVSNDFLWRGMHPFYVKKGIQSAIEAFWAPLRRSLTQLQRREDVFFAGKNDVEDDQSVWTCSMGHFVGLFDRDWLSIPSTGRIAHLRYAEFMRVQNGQIVESAMFFDLIGLMHQAGVYPLPPMTGEHFVYPGPKTHDGMIFNTSDTRETAKTISLMNTMIEDLDSINHLTDVKPSADLLARTWHQDMSWYGPCGIGASYTIERYQAQHQHPFRMNLADKAYHGHVARFADGKYGGFFGWANLSNRNTGGFLGLPEARSSSEMRVMDVYRREGDKLAENWVIIDIPFYLKQQGLDVLERLKSLRRPG